MRSHARALLLLACLTLLSCGRGNSVSTARPVELSQLLPGPQSIARQASFTAGGLDQDGDEYTSELLAQHVITSYTDALFQPNWVPGGDLAGLSYALYSFDVTGFGGNPELNLAWKTDLPSGAAFVGVADWDANAWRWFASQGEAIDLAELAPYAGPDQKLLIAVVVLGTDPQRLGRLSLGPRWHNFTIHQSPFTDPPYYNGVRAHDLAIINGVPCVTFTQPIEWAGQENELYFARATDATGRSWEPSVVVPGGNFSEASSLAEVDGKPAIAANRLTSAPAPRGYDQDLFYFAATDAAGSTWGAPVDVQVDDGNAYGPSLLVLAAGLGLAYTWDDAIGLVNAHVSFATSVDGSDWTPQELSTAPAYYSGPDALLVGGNPAICWQTGPQGLSYMRAGDATGTTWGVGTTLDSSGSIGSLAIVDGKPAVAYAAANQSEARFVQANDAPGDSWSEPATLFTAPFDAYIRGSSLTHIDGVPAFLLTGTESDDFSRPDLTYSYVQATDAQANGWLDPLPIREQDSFVGDDEEGTYAQGLYEVDGGPALLYVDALRQRVILSLYY